MTKEPVYKVLAVKADERSDLIVEDERGQPHLYIGESRTLSRRPLNADFVGALLRSPGWQVVNDPAPRPLSDLRSRVVGS